MEEYSTYTQKQQKWLEMMNYTIQTGIHSNIQETVAALRGLGIHTVEHSAGYPDREPMFPYVKVAIPGYADEAMQVEQADRRAKGARQLFGQFMAADEHGKAELQSQSPILSREEVIHLLHESAEMRKIMLAKHLPLLKPLFAYLSTFYKDRTIPFDYYLVVVKNGPGRVILKSQGAILQVCRPPEEQLAQLHEYQKEMRAFTTFLKAIYFSPSEIRD